ncbi:PD40 domain-containing protein [Dactylosporangium aurantiacum]|uniref:PD40 domain-containing protein n=1 Tax=Dactylosporangium aurantiacum TaxID=35754 RepID=A0A9Q9IK40_9ACTN|nr:PD40 domain-containing protein [Dactylosporangium aurantiacum]MDG6105594.1 PD40 domain-containing protein [Dactylosporangium aurantiacum]UWZ57066.1 PD40 domain-containing protein [Dactylosporangium aurantiacum]
MSTDPQARIGAAVRSIADAVHVDPPDPAVLMARASTRAGRWRPLLSAAGVLGVLAAAALGPGLLAQPAAPTGGTVLPARLAGLSLLTAPVSEAPAGPALLAYVQGSNGPRWLHTLQTVVLSVDGHTYRRLDEAERRGGPAELGTWQDAPVLLAPDGARVAVGSVGPATDVAVVDLRTGRTTTHRGRGAGVIRPLAWSPDGTRLAYTVGDTGSAVLDLTTGASIPLPAPATAAAFSPDGRRLAVQGAPDTEVEPRRAIRILDAAGGTGATELAAAGFGVLIAGQAAWSPDGRWLAVADNAGAGKLDCSISFLPADPADRTPPPAPIVTQDQIALVGWAAPDRPLVTQGSATGHRTVSGPDLRPLTTTGDTTTYDLQAATALLPAARVAPAGDPDRGPWPAWLRLAGAAAVLAGAGLAWWLWSRRGPRGRRA